MKRKFLASLVCIVMVLTLLPATSTFGAPPASVWIGGLELNSANRYYHNGAAGAVGTVDDNPVGANASFDPAAGALTLDGLIVTECAATVEYILCAIYANGDIILSLNGVSYVSTADVYPVGDLYTAPCNYCVFIRGNLTVSGEGSLSAVAGDHVSEYGCSGGIYIEGNLSISSGAIVGTGGSCHSSSNGVRCRDIAMTGGSITGTSGDSREDTKAVNVRNVVISGGSITGTSGCGDACSFGVSVDGIEMTGGSIIGTAGDADDVSAGVLCEEGSTVISGGSITGYGSTGNAASVGVMLDLLNISGGSITGTGGSSPKIGGGVAITGASVVTSGSITGTGSGGDANMGVYFLSSLSVSGDAVISGEASGTVTSHGVQVDGALSVSDSASVTGIGHDTDAYCGASFGLYIDGAVTVSGEGSVSGTAGDTSGDDSTSRGARVDSLTVSDSGSFVGISGHSDKSSNGIKAHGDITLTGGSILGTSSGSNSDSEGVESSYSIIVSGGALTGVGGSSGSCSSGVICETGINLSGGSITAASGDGEDASFGVFTEGNITVSGGSIDATSGDSVYGSCGVYAQGEIVVSNDGSLEGTGGEGQTSAGVYAMQSIVVYGSGSLEGTGDSATNGYSYGVCTLLEMVVGEDGSVEGTGGVTTNGSSYGVNAEGYIIVSGTGTLTGTGAEAGSCSYGVSTYTSLDVTENGVVTGVGGETMVNGGESFGLNVNGYLNVSGSGVAMGTASNADGYSYGLDIDGEIAVLGDGSIVGIAQYAGCGSHAVFTDEYIIICENGSITGTSGHAVSEQSLGVIAIKHITVCDNGTLTGTAGVSEQSWSVGVVSNEEITVCDNGTLIGRSPSQMGVASINSYPITISGGSFTAQGGTMAIGKADLSGGNIELIPSSVVLGGGVVAGTNTVYEGPAAVEYVSEAPIPDGVRYFSTEAVAPSARTYTVSYHANGGTGSMRDPNGPYETGDSVSVLANRFTAPANRRFVEFNTQANGRGTAYAPNGVFTITGDVTLYAIWASKTVVTITPNSAELIYDGTEHSITGFTSNLPAGYIMTGVTVSGRGRDVREGGYTVTVTSDKSAIRVFRNGVDVTREFTFIFETGSLNITPIPVTIAVSSFEKENGEADPTFTATVAGAVSVSDIVYTLSRVEGEGVGSYAITASYEENPNYVITVIDGTLKITEVEIPEPVDPPLIEPETGSWSWVNLVLGAVTVLGALLMIAQFIFGKKNTALKLLGLLPAAGAVVAFLLTQNMDRPMVATDKWTILMAGILAVQVILFFLVRGKKKKS